MHIYKNEDKFYQVGLIGLWEATLTFDERKGRFSNYAYTYMKGKILSQMNRNNQWNSKHIHTQGEFYLIGRCNTGSHHLNKIRCVLPV
ncbi:sigma factor [Neobacillus sp. NPDC093182]|uniref:sigma factor n=1 Tax=Neobacillus sp. NPDC093182 TaxID=3364297 RepID=UPI0037FC8FCD